MNAWIVYNGSIFHESMYAQVEMFERAFKRSGVSCETILNERLALEFHTGPDLTKWNVPDFVLFWSKDVILGHLLSAHGIPVFNTPNAISLSDNKLMTQLSLLRAGVRAPRSVSFPLLYPSFTPPKSRTEELLDSVEEIFGYPIIIKEAYGSFGMQVYLANNRTELEGLYYENMYKPALFQEFIASSKGMDFRVQVVGEKVVASMKRINTNDFRSNVAAGGAIEQCDLDEEYANTAVLASRSLGLDFSGVDILAGPRGEPIVCEVNSNAFVKNISLVSGVDVPMKITEHILENLK